MFTCQPQILCFRRTVINCQLTFDERREVAQLSVILAVLFGNLHAEVAVDYLVRRRILYNPTYSTVLYLYYYEGYKAEEIAKMLSKTTAAVNLILSRARKQLKERLKEDNDE